MAYWVIDDRGFGGMLYTCSECGQCYWDIFDKSIFLRETCPNCGVKITEEERYQESLVKPIKKQAPTVQFVLNGCDISFIAEAPADITLGQLLKQCDKIKPDFCACGICTLESAGYKNCESEIIIGYDDIKKANKNVACDIEEG